MYVCMHILIYIYIYIYIHIYIYIYTRTQDRMARALQTCGDFRWTVLGSSVTAGHDNYFNQSYPIVMEMIISPILSRAGVSFVLKNQAMGGSPAMQSALCVGELAEGNEDVLAWEYDMMTAGRIMCMYVRR
jgi:hypothetical protein